MTGLIVDLFAGGGGASEGIRLALGRCPDVAINHDEAAIAMHEANHPATRHLREDIRAVSPRDAGRTSRAQSTTTQARDRIAFSRGAEPFALEKCEFVKALEDLGYAVDWRVLCAADFGAPTSRKRIFLIARCDGLPIVWPTPTHGQGLLPVRTAAECIDWSIPAPSIFARKKPLADNTLRRIAEGIRRYVTGTPTPYLVTLPEGLTVPSLVQTGYGEREGQAPRCLNIHAPLGTVVSSVKHGLVEAFIERFQLGAFPGRSDQVAAFLTKFYGTSTGAQMNLPMPTVTATGHHLGIVTVHGEAYRIVLRPAARVVPASRAVGVDSVNDEQVRHEARAIEGNGAAAVGSRMPRQPVDPLAR